MIIARFGIPKEIFTNHGSHFQNSMMTKLATIPGFKQEHSSSLYPQENGQVKEVNKTLKTILKCTINIARSNWHIMLYPALWDYRTNVKTATRFSPFQLVHGVEAVTPVEFEILLGRTLLCTMRMIVMNNGKMYSSLNLFGKSIFSIFISFSYMENCT